MMVETDLIVCTDENKNQPVMQGQGFFRLDDINALFSEELCAYTDSLEKLVFRVARKPKNLLSHLQRIYYCFNKGLQEQLFAAIVDFLVVLDRRGQAISWRVLSGAKSHLTDGQFLLIKDYLKNAQAEPMLLQGNEYSIFTRGMIGTNAMVSYVVGETLSEHDPLDIARDHIEYSQLEEAKRVLENAILKQPTRIELQHELLALYQSTRDSEGFNNMSSELKRMGFDIISEWGELDNLFKGQASNG